MHGLSYASMLYEKQLRIQQKIDSKKNLSDSANLGHITDDSNHKRNTPFVMADIKSSSMNKRREARMRKKEANSNE